MIGQEFLDSWVIQLAEWMLFAFALTGFILFIYGLWDNGKEDEEEE